MPIYIHTHAHKHTVHAHTAFKQLISHCASHNIPVVIIMVYMTCG